MPTVTLLAYTPNPEKTVASAAKLCYSSSTIKDLRDGLTDEKAADFVSSCIENTLDEAELYRYGLKFEQSLGILTDYFDALRGAEN